MQIKEIELDSINQDNYQTYLHNFLSSGDDKLYVSLRSLFLQDRCGNVWSSENIWLLDVSGILTRLLKTDNQQYNCHLKSLLAFHEFGNYSLDDINDKFEQALGKWFPSFAGYVHLRHRNRDQALEYFKKASDLGDYIGTQYAADGLYHSGKYEEADLYYKLLIEMPINNRIRGYAFYQRALSLKKMIPEDNSNILELTYEAAVLGHTPALNDLINEPMAAPYLHVIYLVNIGVPRNENLARKYLDNRHFEFLFDKLIPLIKNKQISKDDLNWIWFYYRENCKETVYEIFRPSNDFTAMALAYHTDLVKGFHYNWRLPYMFSDMKRFLKELFALNAKEQLIIDFLTHVFPQYASLSVALPLLRGCIARQYKDDVNSNALFENAYEQISRDVVLDVKQVKLILNLLTDLKNIFEKDPQEWHDITLQLHIQLHRSSTVDSDDCNEAFKFINKSASEGNAKANEYISQIGESWYKNALEGKSGLTNLTKFAPDYPKIKYWLAKYRDDNRKPFYMIKQGEALRLYKEAATADVPEAIVSLGTCFETGHLVPKDEKMALYYYFKAARLGEKSAYQKLKIYSYDYENITLAILANLYFAISQPLTGNVKHSYHNHYLGNVLYYAQGEQEQKIAGKLILELSEDEALDDHSRIALLQFGCARGWCSKKDLMSFIEMTLSDHHWHSYDTFNDQESSIAFELYKKFATYIHPEYLEGLRSLTIVQHVKRFQDIFAPKLQSNQSCFKAENPEASLQNELDDMNYQGDVPPQCLDGFTNRIMDNPVKGKDNHYYDQSTFFKIDPKVRSRYFYSEIKVDDNLGRKAREFVDQVKQDHQRSVSPIFSLNKVKD